MARKYKEARKMSGLKVIEAAKLLGVSQPTLSAWENERKAPGIEKLEAMADLYKVTTDFLLGRGFLTIENDKPISKSNLKVMHGQPVWSKEYGWLMIDAINEKLILSMEESISFDKAPTLYCKSPLFSEALTPYSNPIERSKLNQYDRVWVEPISSDEQLRQELRGWYSTKERWVENEYGNKFYYDCYGAKWLAFEGII